MWLVYGFETFHGRLAKGTPLDLRFSPLTRLRVSGPPLGAPGPPFGGLLSPLGTPLGLLLGRLGPSWSLWGSTWAPLGPSCAPLALLLGRLGPSWSLLVSNRAPLGPSCTPLGRSAARLGLLLASLGPLLGTSWLFVGPSSDSLGLLWDSFVSLCLRWAV